MTRAPITPERAAVSIPQTRAWEVSAAKTIASQLSTFFPLLEKLDFQFQVSRNLRFST
jgi:hypothetical protein